MDRGGQIRGGSRTFPKCVKRARKLSSNEIVTSGCHLGSVGMQIDDSNFAVERHACLKFEVIGGLSAGNLADGALPLACLASGHSKVTQAQAQPGRCSIATFSKVCNLVVATTRLSIGNRVSARLFDKTTRLCSTTHSTVGCYSSHAVMRPACQLLFAL